jgi:hypothetical protein
MPGPDNRSAATGAGRPKTRPPGAMDDIWAPDLGRRPWLWSVAAGGLDNDTADMMRDWQAALGRRER